MNHLERQSGRKNASPQTERLINISKQSSSTALQSCATQKLKWSVAEKAFLREAMNDSASLKVMARALGRSPTAVNKALSRFHIRPTVSEIKVQDDCRQPRTLVARQVRKCKTQKSEVFARRPQVSTWCCIRSREC